jgi:hypothetical protein
MNIVTLAAVVLLAIACLVGGVQAQTSAVAFALSAVVTLHRTALFDVEQRVWYKRDVPRVHCEGVKCPKDVTVPYNTSRVLFFGQWYPPTTALSNDGTMASSLLSRGFTFLPMAGANNPDSVVRVLTMAFPAEGTPQPLDVTAEVNVILAATNQRLPFAMNKTRPENRVHALAYDYALVPTSSVGDILGYQPVAGFPDFYDAERFYDPVGGWWVWRLPNLLRDSICIAVLSTNYFATRTTVAFPWLSSVPPMQTLNPADDRKSTTNPADRIMSCTGYISPSSEATVSIVTTSLDADDVSPPVTTLVRLRPVVYREVRHITVSPSHGRVALAPPFNASHYDYTVYFSSLHSRHILLRVDDRVKSTLAARVIMGSTTVVQTLHYNVPVNLTLPELVPNANGSRISVAMADVMTSLAAEVWFNAAAVYHFTLVYSNESWIYEPLRVQENRTTEAPRQNGSDKKEFIGWEWEKWMYLGIAVFVVALAIVFVILLRFCRDRCVDSAGGETSAARQQELVEQGIIPW